MVISCIKFGGKKASLFDDTCLMQTGVSLRRKCTLCSDSIINLFRSKFKFLNYTDKLSIKTDNISINIFLEDVKILGTCTVSRFVDSSDLQKSFFFLKIEKNFDGTNASLVLGQNKINSKKKTLLMRSVFLINNDN